MLKGKLRVLKSERIASIKWRLRVSLLFLVLLGCQPKKDKPKVEKVITNSKVEDTIAKRLNLKIDSFAKQKFPDKILLDRYSYYPVVKMSDEEGTEEFVDSTKIVGRLMLADKTDTSFWAVYFIGGEITLDHEVTK